MNTHKISIIDTSNPTILKFETTRFLVKNSYEYNNIDDAKNSPLAQQLFYLPFVKKVYISGNFIAIQRYDIVDWKDVSNDVALQIEEYLNANKVVVNEPETTKKTPVTVYAESTPNPSVMKFVANKHLVGTVCEFNAIDETQHAPFAKALFHFPFIKSVFLDKNYVSITKYNIVEWQDVTLELREFVTTYISEGKPILNTTSSTETNSKASNTASTETLDDTSKTIIQILNEYVQPAVASDGGHIQFKNYDANTKTVSVLLQGACSGCPSSTFTLKNGIETMLKDMLKDKVEHVEAING